MKTKGTGAGKARFKNFLVRNKGKLLGGLALIAGLIGVSRPDIQLGEKVLDRVIPSKTEADTVITAKGDTIMYNEFGQVVERRDK